MAVSIPTSAYQQVNESYALDTSGLYTRRVQFKGTDFNALKTAAGSIERGDAYDDWIVGAWDLTTIPGGGGTLTLSLVPDDGQSAGGGLMAQRAVWTCKSVRNDVSILSYCGASAQRVDIELWQKEPEQKLAENYLFHTDKTNTSGLNSQEQEIAKKIEKGIDSVIRFYAVLACTSYWSRLPSDMMKDIGYIDTPGGRNATTVEEPSNLSSIIGKHSWLKVQDDVADQGGVFVRTESWMGIPTADGTGWDKDLYGENRWAMPKV